MNRAVSNVSGAAYKRIAKPILFKTAPDTVHQRLVQSARILQRARPLRGAMHTAWAYAGPSLRQRVAGITFDNPVGLSAGFDKNFELVPLIKSLGFGFMEGGSLTLEPCAGNPRPWFYRLPKTRSIVVYAGLANQGVERIVQRITNYPAGTFDHFPLNISVAKTNSPTAVTVQTAIADYTGSLAYLEGSGVGDMYTLNISCPNTYGGEPFTRPELLEALLAEVDELELSRPVFIKMPSHLDWPEFRELVDVAARHRIAGLTISNLAKDRRTASLADPLPDDIQGNLSGRPTWDLSNNLIRRTRLAYGERFVIIGVGGVFTAQDAYTKIRLGANLVELITGLIYEGPALIGQINAGLAALLRADGLSNISEAVGVDAT